MKIAAALTNSAIMVKPKKISRIRQWWPLHNHRPVPVAGKKKLNGSLRDYSTDNSSKESLLAGELSDGLRGGSRRVAAAEVPKGFLAVYVGPELRRFVIPASYLSMPDFRDLMDKVAEEFGVEHEGGALKFPCEEEDFEAILVRCMAMQRVMSKSKKKKN